MLSVVSSRSIVASCRRLRNQRRAGFTRLTMTVYTAARNSSRYTHTGRTTLSLSMQITRRALVSRHPLCQPLNIFRPERQPKLGATPQNVIRLGCPLMLEQIACFTLIQVWSQQRTQILHTLTTLQQLVYTGAIATRPLRQ